MKKWNDRVRAIISVGFLLAYIGLQSFIVMSHDYPHHDLVSARLQDALMLILAYWFGASHKKE